jgi:hypothetical protein
MRGAVPAAFQNRSPSDSADGRLPDRACAKCGGEGFPASVARFQQKLPQASVALTSARLDRWRAAAIIRHSKVGHVKAVTGQKSVRARREGDYCVVSGAPQRPNSKYTKPGGQDEENRGIVGSNVAASRNVSSCHWQSASCGMDRYVGGRKRTKVVKLR